MKSVYLVESLKKTKHDASEEDCLRLCALVMSFAIPPDSNLEFLLVPLKLSWIWLTWLYETRKLPANANAGGCCFKNTQFIQIKSFRSQPSDRRHRCLTRLCPGVLLFITFLPPLVTIVGKFNIHFLRMTPCSTYLANSPLLLYVTACLK